MAMHKLSGGVEDLTFGMGTEQQVRQGTVYVITQIHAGFIPYSSTQSITQKVDQIDATSSATRTDLDNHKVNYNNPHNVTSEDVGAANLVHTHPESDIDGLTEDLANKSDLGHQHAISDVTNLQTTLDAKMDDGDAFLKTDHVVESAGGTDAGKPIVLDNAGKLDPTIAGSGLIFIAMFTPTAGTEYPDDTGYSHGSYWGIEGVDEVLGYTFTGGDLAGATLFNGDALVVGSEEWGYVNIGIDPNIYYPLDGSVAISAPFAGGGQQLKNIADGSDPTDAVALQQLTTGYLPLAGGTLTGGLIVDATEEVIRIGSMPNTASYIRGVALDGVANGWYIGRGSSVSNVVSISNYIADANINFATIGTGIVSVNGNEIWHAGNFNPANYVSKTGIKDLESKIDALTARLDAAGL